MRASANGETYRSRPPGPSSYRGRRPRETDSSTAVRGKQDPPGVGQPRALLIAEAQANWVRARG
jgi:hypothetical protein